MKIRLSEEMEIIFFALWRRNFNNVDGVVNLEQTEKKQLLSELRSALSVFHSFL